VYLIGESGSVTLDTAGDVLTIVAVTPNDGWTLTKSEVQDAHNAEVRFEANGSEVEFHANLLLGVVTTAVDANDLSATADSVVDHGGSSGGGSSGGGSDDGGGAGHGGGGDDD
jgi:uncharacterized membrane protein YgcG